MGFCWLCVVLCLAESTPGTERNPETRAFAAAYRVDDDDDEFAHLEVNELTLVGAPIEGSYYDKEEDENDELAD